jgi:hypothetical protein
MNKFDNDRAKIEIGYVTFHFDWNWIKAKQIIHKGNKYYGMLFILDEEGQAVKMYGYELIGKDENE